MAKDVIYGIVKVPTIDVTNYTRVETGAPMECFDSTRAARAYMSKQLDSEESRQDFSWALLNPKTPEQPIGLTQSYVVFAINVTDAVSEYVQTHRNDKLDGVDGYIGRLPHNPARHMHQATMIGKDSVGPTVYIPASGKADKTKAGEVVSERQFTCRHKQSKLEVEMERKVEKEKKHNPSIDSDEHRNGQRLVSYWCDQLNKDGLYQYAGQLHAEFNRHFLGGRAYETDGITAAYTAIQTVFERVSREAVKNGNFELATNARNIAEMAGDALMDEESNKRLEAETTEQRSWFTPEEASALVGYDIGTREDW